MTYIGKKSLISALMLGAAIASSVLSGCAAPAAENGVRAHGRLSVEDGRLVGENGSAVQLRGMSTHGIAWFPEFVNSGAFASIKSAGGNVVRAAMYTDTENGYLADPETNLSLIDTAVSLARDLDMYVIVDWHILSDGDPNENLEAAIGFFEKTSARYADDSAVIYEICNEPNGVDWDDIKTYAESVIPVIRKNSEKALIIVGTPGYSSELSGALLNPLPYENIMYAYHFYAGMHSSFETLKYAVSQEMPVFVSEWGIGEDDSGKAAIASGKDFASYLNGEGISWCAWSLCYKDEVFSALTPDASPDGGWDKKDFTEVGQALFAALHGSDK